MGLSNAITLDNSDKQIEIESNFKLCAGPGAGKTRFLINHINNVIERSERLTIGKKIACITYTNVGVETIKKRLHNSNEVEVSTIHSFLYNHVLKPYLWVINEEYNIPLADLKGHEEIIPTFKLLKNWADTVNNPKFRFNILYNKEISKAEIIKSLKSLHWILQADGSVTPELRYYGLPIKKDFLNDYLTVYKKLCWEKGMISHEDVLFLSYKIFKRKNDLLTIMRAKFPYIFVDEFQDTNPIQSKILEMIGEKETIVGVIGDVGQSIFKFQGANVHDFIKFNLKDMKLYNIKKNHRSTNQIIKVLNHVRNDEDFSQISPEMKNGNIPQIIIGDSSDACEKVFMRDKQVCVLSYKNDIVNSLKYDHLKKIEPIDMNNFLFKETNGRSWLIGYAITAIEYGREGKIQDAINYMTKAYRKNKDFGDKEALKIIIRLINCYDLYKKGSIKKFYNEYLYDYSENIPKITSGQIGKLNYEVVASSVKIDETTSLFRTIHNSKGAEFKSVLVVIPKEEDLKFLLNQNIKEEDNRVYYVALSRATDNLFINVIPQISKNKKKKLEKIGFEIVDMKQ